MEMKNKKMLEEKFKNLINENKNFVFLNGNKKILISAPHAVEQTREGKIKYSEPETALIALSLNTLGFPCIIKTTNENDDVNYDLESEYKKKLLSYCKENDIKFILDLHQLSPARDVDICLGTGNDQNCNLVDKQYLLSTITNEIDKSKFNYKINFPYAASGIRTISGYMSSLKYSSLQLEINCKLISGYCNGQNFEEVCQLIKNIVLNVEKDITEYENTISK